MPRYFYVRSNGSNSPALTIDSDTPYTSLQTGAFPADANCYACLEDAVEAGLKSTPASAGDFIILAADHDYTYPNADIWITQPWGDWSGAVAVISASISNCDQYQAGATERVVGSANDLELRFSGHHYGVNYYCERLVDFTVSNKIARFVDCYFEIKDRGWTLGQESSALFHNCNLIHTGTGTSSVAFFQLNASATLRMYGGAISYNPALVSTTRWFQIIRDGCEVFLDGVDLSSAVGFTGLLNLSTNTVESLGTVRVNNCKLPAGVPVIYSQSGPFACGGNILFTNSSSVASERPYARYWQWRGDTAEDETGFYRTGSDALPSGDKISIRIDTDSRCGSGEVFVFPLTQMYVDLSSASTDKITFYILSAAQLYDNEVWIELTYADQSVAGQVNFQSTRGNILVGTELQTNSEAWNNYTSQYRYEISFDTSVLDPGGAGVFSARCCVAKPSTTFFICPTPVLS